MNHLPYWERWLDEVGAQGVDLALLPESFNGCGGEHTMKDFNFLFRFLPTCSQPF
jgi:hypothetical protein